MQVKKLIFSLCFLCSVFGLMAQNAITVKGTITSKSDGEPIIGASVVQTNSPNVGTATDLDGNFVLKVADGSTITVSYIGYKSVPVKAAPTVSRTRILPPPSRRTIKSRRQTSRTKQRQRKPV